MGALLVAKSPTFLQAESDYADAQTDLNLCCKHMPTSIACWIIAHYEMNKLIIRQILFIF